MSIKSRLFGKPWQQRDPSIRASAVAESDDPELLRELGRIAEHDESASVRLAALNRINTEPFWLDARLRETDPAIVEAADAHLVKAVMQRPGDRLVKERLEWFSRMHDSDFLRRVAQKAPDRALREQALTRIDSPGFLGDRVIDEPDEDLAIALVPRIEQESTLERIETRLRRKSKRRAGAVTERLRELRSARGEYDAVSESAARLVERAEKLARGDIDGDRQQILDDLREQWRQLDAPDEGLARRFNGALEIVRRAIEAPERTRRVVETEAESVAPAATDRALTEVVEGLESINDPERIQAEEAAQWLGHFDRAWQQLKHSGPEEVALRERALPVLRILQQRRQAALAPRSDKDAKAATPAEKSSEAKPEATNPSPTEDWQGDLDALAGHIEAGTIVEAQSAARDLRSKIDRLKPRQRPRDVAGRLGRLEGRLREMRQWEHWSNNKHRDELIERIEQLAESGQHPDAVSAALKEARKEWQQLEDLEVLPGDKRRHAAPSGQWRRFQAACKNAFEQAQPFFEKRHEVQAENLEQLDTFVARGHEVADDESAGIDSLKSFMRGARLAIRRLDDLPPKSRGDGAARLRELMDRLSGRLDEAFEAIENGKRRLVREAQALEREPDLASAIDKAKSLQARWKEAGTGRRRIDQQLWKEFRAPIDPLFDKLQEQRGQQREQQQAEVAALRELVDKAQSLADCDEAELESAEGRMRALRSEWEEAGRRPARLVKDFERAERALDKRLEDRHHALQREARQQLDELAQAVQAAWRARDAAQPHEPALPDDAPDSGTARRLIETAREVADDQTDTEALARRVEENGKAARQVVIEMEFLAGMDSPSEDNEARMNFQVGRLAQRMSERGQTPSLGEELADLCERWYAAFPQPLDEHESIAKRFRKCQNVLESMSGKE